MIGVAMTFVGKIEACSSTRDALTYASVFGSRYSASRMPSLVMLVKSTGLEQSLEGQQSLLLMHMIMLFRQRALSASPDLTHTR
jgi:hypothetical protein